MVDQHKTTNNEYIRKRHQSSPRTLNNTQIKKRRNRRFDVILSLYNLTHEQDVVEFFKTLTTAKYAPSYIKQLANYSGLTITKDIKQNYSFSRKNVNCDTEIYNMSLTVIDDAFKIIKSKEFQYIDNKELECYFAIILVYFTCLRTNEFLQLTVKDLFLIINKQPVSIKFKKTYNSQIINVQNTESFTKFSAIIYEHVFNRERLLNLNLNIFNKTITQNLLYPIRLFSFEKTTLVNMLKKIFMKIEPTLKSKKIGFIFIRRVVITKMLKIMDPIDVSLFTRHKGVKNLEFYNMGNIE